MQNNDLDEPAKTSDQRSAGRVPLLGIRLFCIGR